MIRNALVKVNGQPVGEANEISVAHSASCGYGATIRTGAPAELGTDMQSPYIDTRDALHAGVPEVRRYRLRYVKSDVPTGDYTDTITVTTTP